jgi:hypothetical protein
VVAPPAGNEEADNIVLDKAKRDDEQLIGNQVMGGGMEGRLLSHNGDYGFITDRPKVEDYNYQNDPQWQILQQRRQLIQDNPAPSAAVYNTAMRNLTGQEKALQKKYQNDYKTANTEWQKAEVAALRDSRGHTIKDKSRVELGTAIDTARDTIRDDAVAKKLPNTEYTALNDKVMNPDQFQEIGLHLMEQNNMTPKRAAQTLLHLTRPVVPGEQPLNGRSGLASAHYQVVGHDAAHNVLLQSEDGVLAVPRAQFYQIEKARMQLTQQFRNRKQAAPSLSIGQRVDKLLGR